MADNRKAELTALLEKQRAAFTAARPEPLDVRRDRIERAMALLKENGEKLCRAMSADFGNRSPHQSMITDIAGTVGFGRYCLKHLGQWSKSERRKVQFPLGLPVASGGFTGDGVVTRTAAQLHDDHYRVNPASAVRTGRSGSSWYDGSNAGRFSLNFNYGTASSSDQDIGFRCAIPAD